MRKILFLGVGGLAAVLAGAAGAVHAQGVTDISGYVPRDVGNVVGGGSATIVGGGDNLVILYSGGGAGGGGGNPGQSGRLARISGNDGSGPQVEYLNPAPAGRGREAWLIGGGDNAEVVYSSFAAQRLQRR